MKTELPGFIGLKVKFSKVHPEVWPQFQNKALAIMQVALKDSARLYNNGKKARQHLEMQSQHGSWFDEILTLR